MAIVDFADIYHKQFGKKTPQLANALTNEIIHNVPQNRPLASDLLAI